jgi:hypothetical protein
MEGELWKALYQMVKTLDTKRKPRRGKYTDAVVVLTFVWSVLHDRPRKWACDANNWPMQLRHRALPSASTLTRRLRTESVQRMLSDLDAMVCATSNVALLLSLDAKPLPVGGWSKDPDARWGQAVRTKAKGYKLYAVCNSRGEIAAWTLHAMNVPEPEAARELIPQLNGEGYLLGDALYDSNELYDLAAARGRQLVAPRKKPGRGLGHRRHSPARLRSIRLLESGSRFGCRLHAQRNRIEGTFGTMGNIGCGLAPLPNWVRRLPRVRLWVQTKLIIHHTRLRLKQTA